HPGLFPLLIDQILEQTAQPLGAGRHDPRTGAGLVQVIDPTVTPVVGAVVNASRETGNQSEVAVAIDPKNPNNVALSSNENDINPGQGLYLSKDGGATWTKKVIGNGSDGLPNSIGDPSLAWDTFGNLYVAYVNASDITKAVIDISTDGGATFQNLTQIAQTAGTGQILDQDTIAVGPDTGGTGQSIWLTASDVGASMPVLVAGAHITGLGAANVSAFSTFTVNFTPTNVSNFSDISIGPNG